MVKECGVSKLSKNVISTFVLMFLFVLSAIFVSGAYSVSITAPALNSFNSGNVTVTIAVFEDGVAANSSNNLTNITVEAVQINSTGVVVAIANITNSYFTEANYNLTNATYSFAWDTSNGSYGDGEWAIRVNVTGNLSSSSEVNTSTNTTTVHIFVVDNTVPNGTIAIENNVGVDVTTSEQAGYGQDVTVKCNAADLLSGINTTSSSVSVKVPGLTFFENVTLTTNTNTSLVGFIPGSKMETLGKFEIMCVIKDNALNLNVTAINLTTLPVVVDSSPFVDPNFVAPLANKVIGKDTVENYAEKYGEIPDEGVPRLIKKHGAIILLVAGEEHTIKVEELGEDSVTLMISSEPFNVDMNVGETKEIDVNGDGVNDLEVFFNKVHQKAADLVFKEISTPAPIIEEETTGSQPESTPTAAPQEESKDYTWILTLLGMVVIAAILMFVIHHFSNKGDENGGGAKVKFTPRDLGATREESPWESGKEKGPFY